MIHRNNVAVMLSIWLGEICVQNRFQQGRVGKIMTPPKQFT